MPRKYQTRNWEVLGPQVKAMLEDQLSLTEIARRLDIPHATLTSYLKKVRSQEPETESKIVEGDLEAPWILNLLSRAGVSLDEWQPVRAVINQWAQSTQAKVWLHHIGYNPERIVEEARRAFEAAIADIHLPDVEYVQRGEPHLLEVAPVDTHVGMLAWGEEVGAKYDTSIAVDRHKVAVLDLLGRASSYHFDQVVIPVGNDLLHADSPAMTTTAGTRVDVDTRFPKMFRIAHQLMSWTILQLRQVAPVTVLVIPGNHDYTSAFMVGEVLAAQFQNDPHVHIDNHAKLRKYHSYGSVLLGFTHGNHEVHRDLPLIMADEEPQLWAEARFREWHIGHRHNKKQVQYVTHDQFRVTGVRTLPSLTSPDFWHYRQGYRHLPQAEAHVWHRRFGHVANFTHTPTPEESKS